MNLAEISPCVPYFYLSAGASCLCLWAALPPVGGRRKMLGRLRARRQMPWRASRACLFWLYIGRLRGRLSVVAILGGADIQAPSVNMP